MAHILYLYRFFYFFDFIEYFLYIFLFQGKKFKILTILDSDFVELNILRLVMFYNLNCFIIEGEVAV